MTRPEPGASATAGLLARLGFTPVLLPCLAIETLPASLPAQPAAIIVTSAQAIPALPGRYCATPCFCVGDATAAKMAAAGFTCVESAGGDAGDLCRLVTARRISGTHLLAVGEGHGVALAQGLRANGVRVLRRRLYRTRPLRSLPAPVAAALANGEIAKALFYSAETARSFARLRPPGTAAMQALALSPAVAAACRTLPWRSIHVALAPNEAELLALLK